MNKIKAAIIEDEIPAGRLLHKMLSGLRPDWEIVVLPGSIEGSVKWFQEHPHPDIIFLDIQLTDGISFTFIEQAQPESMIIFTTAYDEYAIRAFTVNSIDYLLKPINRERLAEAIEKFERLTARYGNTTLSSSSNELLNLLKNISNPEKKYRTRFLISGDEKLYTLQVEDIAYFYSENKITFAVTKEGKESGGIVGIGNISCGNAASVYPNPITNGETLTIETISGSSIRLITIQGATLIQLEATDNVTKLPVNNLSQGIYLLTITNNTGKQTFKIIVK